MFPGQTISGSTLKPTSDTISITKPAVVSTTIESIDSTAEGNHI